MNRINRLIACSFLVAAPVFVLAQGNAGQMSQGGMMNQEHMQQMHENMSRMQGMMQQMPNAGSQAPAADARAYGVHAGTHGYDARWNDGPGHDGSGNDGQWSGHDE